MKISNTELPVNEKTLPQLRVADVMQQPFFNQKDVTILNENCLDTMAKMPNNFVDLVVTSPPYDDLRNYKGFSFDVDKIAKELFRLIKIGGCVVWVVGDSTKNGCESGTSFKQALTFINAGFNLNDTMIFEKKNPLPTDKTYRYYQCFEFMFVFSRGQPKTFNPLTEPTIGIRKTYKSSWGRDTGDKMIISTGKQRTVADEKIRRNIWEYGISLNVATTDKIAFEHPAIFPEQLANDHIISWSNEGDLVYDPFGGSGTTVKMAHLRKRKCIMSEISTDYCQVAKKRIEPYLMQERLF